MSGSPKKTLSPKKPDYLEMYYAASPPKQQGRFFASPNKNPSSDTISGRSFKTAFSGFTAGGTSMPGGLTNISKEDVIFEKYV
jgi:hypothetical protein